MRPAIALLVCALPASSCSLLLEEADRTGSPDANDTGEPVGAYDCDANTLVLFHFEDASDDCGGEPLQNPSFTSEGVFGGALAPLAEATQDRDALLFTDRFTVEAWVNPDPPQLGVAAPIVAWQTGGASSRRFEMKLEGSATDWTLELGGDCSPLTSLLPTIAAETWTHIAVAQNPSTLSIYINGNRQDDEADLTDDCSLSANSSIAVGGTTDGYFRGTIDELRISNIARGRNDLVFTLP